MEFIHIACLKAWMRVSPELTCRLCLTPYTLEEIVLEPVYQPPVKWVARLVMRTPILFGLLLAYYTTYLMVYWPVPGEIVLSVHHEFVRFVTRVAQGIPSILLCLTATQGLVLVPAIYAVKQKGRYLRYLLTCQPLYGLVAIGLCAVLRHLVTATVGYVVLLSYLYPIHCSIVAHINRDILNA